MARTGEARIFTIPNLISVGRLLCLPVFLYVLFGLDDRARAAYLLGALGATDWIDGFIARRFDQVSDLGKVLDPTADRLLFFVGVLGIVIDGSVPVWFAVAVLARESIVSIAAIGLAAAGARRIDVTWFGKAGTFSLMFAFPFFLGGNSGITWAETSNTLAWLTGIPGLALSYYAAFLYVPLGRRALREGREAASETVVGGG